MLLGAAVGAAAVYGYEEGDPLAAVRLAPRVQDELSRVGGKVERHLGEKQEKVSSGLRRLSRKAQGHLDSAVDDVAADMQLQLREVSRDIDVDAVIGRLEKGLDAGLQQLPQLSTRSSGAASSNDSRRWA